MERDQVFFLITVLLVITLNLALWRYVVVADQTLNQKVETAFSTTSQEFDDLRGEYDSRINQHTSRLNLVEQSVQQHAEKIQQQLSTNFDQLSTQLDDVANDNKQLEKQLLSIDVRSTDFSGVVDEVLQSVVSIHTASGGGSGVVVDTRGYIVTNYHVVSSTSQVEIVSYKRGSFAGKVIGHDPVFDIAVIKIDGSLPRTKFGDSENMKVGQKVVALGSPAGLDFSVTEGIISAQREDSRGVSFFQIDVPINPGNSGGPLISNTGRIVGITQSKISELEGVGFAVQGNDVKRIVEDLIQSDLEE